MSRPHQNAAVHRHAGKNPPTTLSEPHAPPPPSSKPNTNFLSLILKALIMSLLTSLFFVFLGLAAIFLLHLFLASRQFHRRTRRRTNFRDRPTPGLSSRDLQKLPEFRYHAGNDKKTVASVSDCVICLEGFKKGDFFRVLPDCKHVFHSRCVDSWLVKMPSCPICRGNVGLSCVEEEEEGGDKEMWEIGVC